MLKDGDVLTFTVFDTSLGWMGVVGSLYGLKRVILPQKSKKLVEDQIISCGCVCENRDPSCFGDLPDRLRRYLEGEPVSFPDKLDLTGTTHFQRRVWQLVCTIPSGETRSYGWLAQKIGSSKAARGVGQALGRNQLPIIIPCHRVIKSDGSLGGFGGGVEIKKLLLRLEQAPGGLTVHSCSS